MDRICRGGFRRGEGNGHTLARSALSLRPTLREGNVIVPPRWGLPPTSLPLQSRFDSHARVPHTRARIHWSYLCAALKEWSEPEEEQSWVRL